MTIFALSSGPGISGVAVIRVSGKKTADVWYLFLTLLTEQIPLITVVATMGLSRTSTALSNTLNNFYSNIFGTSISQASSIIFFDWFLIISATPSLAAASVP